MDSQRGLLVERPTIEPQWHLFACAVSDLGRNRNAVVWLLHEAAMPERGTTFLCRRHALAGLRCVSCTQLDFACELHLSLSLDQR